MKYLPRIIRCIDVYETIFMNFIRGIATSKGIMFIDEFVDRTENA